MFKYQKFWLSKKGAQQMVHHTRVIRTEILAYCEFLKCYIHEICLQSVLQVRRKVATKNSLENYVYSLRNTLRDDKVRH